MIQMTRMIKLCLIRNASYFEIKLENCVIEMANNITSKDFKMKFKSHKTNKKIVNTKNLLKNDFD